MIQSVAFFAYPVSDIPRARAFYEQSLGLKVSHNLSEGWVEYDLGDSTFAITSMDAEHQPGAKGGVVAFEVDALAETVASLKQKQVAFTVEQGESPVCHFAIVADPDGSQVILHKRKG
jgi:predicted enzyme related to lactoylglutathione lyase